MELVISAVIGLLLGAFVVFAVIRIREQNTKKTAQSEAEKIINKAKSESAKLKKDSENKAKDFETKTRKNVESEINKQKAQLKNKESQLERRLKEIEDQHKQRQEDNDKFAQGLKDRQERIAISESRLRELERTTQEQIDFVQKKLENIAGMSQEQAKRELFQVLEEAAKKKLQLKLQKLKNKL